jgi:hypothetical protein
MPKHKRGFIPSRYSLVQPIGTAGNSGTSSESKETLNILNGVLNCAWDKTSYSPKLLEIYDNSKVKFNVSSDDPLVLAFANGWDDLDRPAQVVKRLAAAPSNIDLSAKANCHVQIVAKVINDELVLTTNDVLDVNLGYGQNVLPNFATGRGGTNLVATKDGWTIQASGPVNGTDYPWKAADGNTGTDFTFADGVSGWLMLDPPCPISISLVTGYNWISRTDVYRLAGWDGYQWVDLLPPSSTSTSLFGVPINSEAGINAYSRFGLWAGCSGSGGFIYNINAIYERPTVKYYRSMNKVKDRSDTEVYWINLGYAMMDASGNISALYHYTNLLNNYPGGMRVEV